MEDVEFARGAPRVDASAASSASELERRVLGLLRALSRALRKASRRVEAVTGDLAAIDDAQAWAGRAPWLVAAAAKATRGATVLQVPDWSTGTETLLELPLDPARPAQEQVESIFAEARRLRRGRDRVVVRLERAQREHANLEASARELSALAELAQLAASPDLDVDLAGQLAALEERARALLPRGVPIAPGEKIRPPERRPYREFIVTGDLHVLVGKDAKSNDELTLHVAKPHHVWLHAKDHTGSHVVACVGKGHALTPEQLVDAAHLAAYFSDARGEIVVEVSYLPKRFVRKPRKSPPGLVVLDREKVIVLRVDSERMQRLLAPPGTEAP